MPVNGFSFVSESFLSFIVQHSPGRACMLESAPRKSGTAAPDWAFDITRDRTVAEDVALSVWLRNFAPHGRNRKRKPTLPAVSQESPALLASSRKEKNGRSPQCLRGFHVNFPLRRAGRTNRQSKAKATRVQETDARLAIAN